MAVEGYEPDPVALESGAEGGEGRGEADGGETIGGAPLVPLSVASNVRKFLERALIMEDEKWCVREDLVQ